MRKKAIFVLRGLFSGKKTDKRAGMSRQRKVA